MVGSVGNRLVIAQTNHVVMETVTLVRLKGSRDLNEAHRMAMVIGERPWRWTRISRPISSRALDQGKPQPTNLALGPFRDGDGEDDGLVGGSGGAARYCHPP